MLCYMGQDLFPFLDCFNYTFESVWKENSPDLPTFKVSSHVGQDIDRIGREQAETNGFMVRR